MKSEDELRAELRRAGVRTSEALDERVLRDARRAMGPHGVGRPAPRTPAWFLATAAGLLGLAAFGLHALLGEQAGGPDERSAVGWSHGGQREAVPGGSRPGGAAQQTLTQAEMQSSEEGRAVPPPPRESDRPEELDGPRESQPPAGVPAVSSGAVTEAMSPSAAADADREPPSAASSAESAHGTSALAPVPRTLDARATRREAEFLAKVAPRMGSSNLLLLRVLSVYEGGAELVGEEVEMAFDVRDDSSSSFVQRSFLGHQHLIRSSLDPELAMLVCFERVEGGRSAEGRWRVRNPISGLPLGTLVLRDNPGGAAADGLEGLEHELVRALEHGDTEMRKGAIAALRSFESGSRVGQPGRSRWMDRRTLQVLLEAAEDPDPCVRWTVAWMAPSLARGSALDALLHTLAVDADPVVRRQARWRLAEEYGDKYVAAWNGGVDPGWEPWASPETESCYDLRVGLATQQGWTDLFAPEREFASSAKARSCGRSASCSVPELVSALHDADVEVRRWSAWALGQMGASLEAKGALLAVPPSEDARVRAAVGESLVRQGHGAGIEVLGDTIRGADVVGACRALDALLQGDTLLHVGFLGHGESVANILQAAAHDPRAEVRAQLALGLGWLERVPDEEGELLELLGAEVVDQLLQALRGDEERLIRRLAGG